jgi:hypothetical protein
MVLLVSKLQVRQFDNRLQLGTQLNPSHVVLTSQREQDISDEQFRQPIMHGAQDDKLPVKLQ